LKYEGGEPLGLIMYEELTIKNRSALKRFSHHRRFLIAMDLLDVQVGERVLDYGTGDGHTLRAILNRNPQCEVFGYEPVPSMYEELREAFKEDPLRNEIQIASELKELPKGYFDKVCCLEVMEHLTEANQREALRNIADLLRDDGKSVISVPIEVGFASLAKNAARTVLGQRDEQTDLKNIVKSLFGLPIERADSDYIYSHMGFYYPDFEAVVTSEGFSILVKEFSPFSMMRGFLNSQVFYIVSPGR
jgi:SAM-dependent methyltransferase